ncbi:MAG: DUF1385 domain-containing protein [Ruminococcaceae bacterium]|nr:DUF1385 domain-containing protein [Oscillospiraceae bacterium]
MSKNQECILKKTSIGGQAVMEGVMMRGPEKTVMVVRTPDGEIVTEEIKITPASKKNKFFKLPFIRGVVSFIESMIIGYKTISRSAELSGLDDLEEEEPSKFEQWLTKITGGKLFNVIMYVSVVLGVLFSVLLFTILPTLITAGINAILPFALNNYIKTIIESILRISIFITYLALVSHMKDIRRVFEYHGAEHKTIFTYEKGLDLTVENVRDNLRFHPRCGTSFLFLVMIVGIIVYSLPIIPWSNILLRIPTKLCFLPVIAGISYELIRLAGKYDNIFTRIISAPGLWLQRLTTKEPDDSQIEVAITSLRAVIPENQEEDK